MSEKKSLNPQNFSLLPVSKKSEEVPEDGLLHPLPGFCKNKFNEKCIKHYRECPEGPSTCPYGFSTVVFKSEGRTIKWTGLKVKGHYNKVDVDKRKSTHGLPKLTLEKIQEYKDKTLEVIKRLNSSFDEKIDHANKKLEFIQKHTINSFHEIRPLNAEVKAAILRIKSTLGAHKSTLDRDYDTAKRQLDAVSNSSDLISIRMKLRDFLINPLLVTQSEKKRIDIKNEIYSIINMYKSHLKRDQVQVNVTIPNSSQLKTNESFKIILYVLLENAIKYSPSGLGQEIDISEEKNDQTGKYEIKISSMGPKIHPEEMDKIFNAFERGVEASKYDGNGVGLYAAQRIASQLESEISATQAGNSFEFDSETFYSTTFFITCPYTTYRFNKYTK